MVAAGDLCWGQSWPLLQPPHCAVSAEWLPRKAENLTPYTMALIAKYVARHRLREPRLLDTIANFLLKRGEQLDSKVSIHLTCGVTSPLGSPHLWGTPGQRRHGPSPS